MTPQPGAERELYRRALRVTPFAAQTFSRKYPTVGTDQFPAFASDARGAYLWTSDGTKYIDLAGATATAPLGFNHPAVQEAVIAEARRCGTLSLPTALEVEVSEAMVAAVPFAEQVRWVRTGSEAVSGAVTTARRATGRHRVIVFTGNYHGWHPWTGDDHSRILVEAGAELLVEGMPFHAAGLCDAAAVIVEPPRMAPITPAYRAWLRSLREECTSASTVLVYDDVVWGFRFATGGLQEETGVQPDIACFSKALGNGIPVGCLAGTKAVMADTPVSSTFGGERLGLAAASAVLAIHFEREVCEDLARVGVRLRGMLDEAVTDTPIEIYGTPLHFRFQLRDSAYWDAVGDRRRHLFNMFLNGCLDERLLVHRAANNVSLAMDDTIVLARISHAVKTAAQGL